MLLIITNVLPFNAFAIVTGEIGVMVAANVRFATYRKRFIATMELIAAVLTIFKRQIKKK